MSVTQVEEADMARRWIVLLLAISLSLAVVPLAAAGKDGNGGKGKLKFELVGTVSAVDGVVGLTVHVKAGSKRVKSFRGSDLRLVMAPGARVRVVSAAGRTTATLADIPVGAKVKVRGRVDRSDPANLAYVALGVKARVPAALAVSPLPSSSLVK